MLATIRRWLGQESPTPRAAEVALPPLPLQARHIEYSAIVSADDDPGRPSERLLDVALQAAQRARSVSMAQVSARLAEAPDYPAVWPGEHYKLLAALVAVYRPKQVIEIGTATGLSALAMREYLPAGSRLATFDIVPWDDFPDTCLRDDDFADGALSQIIGDVSDPEVMQQHAGLFGAADLIFVDGPKDGRFERVLLDRLVELDLRQRPLLVFDDIRVWNMLAIWRAVALPKLDLTSFGHWSGTGLVDWTWV